MGLSQRKEKDEEQVTILKIKTGKSETGRTTDVESQENCCYMDKIYQKEKTEANKGPADKSTAFIRNGIFPFS